jgi:hypothetical protein
VTHYEQTHKVRDGAFGVLNALFGVGVHHVEIRDTQGTIVGRGTGPSEAAARQAAWKDVHQKEPQQA